MLAETLIGERNRLVSSIETLGQDAVDAGALSSLDQVERQIRALPCTDRASAIALLSQSEADLRDGAPADARPPEEVIADVLRWMKGQSH